METTTPPLQTLSAWLLDQDGDIYGTDERERLRWYEGIAVAASVQWIIVPIVMAVAAWVGGRAVAPALLAVTIAFYLPMALVNTYVTQRRVRVTPQRYSRKRVLVSIATFVPFAPLGIGLARGYGLFEDSTSLFVGIVGGTAVVLLTVIVSASRRDRRTGAVTSENPDHTG